MKKVLLTIVSLVFFVMYGMAQDCYSDNRSQGVAAYNNGKYAEAKKYFQSAQNCDMKPRQNDVADWIGKCDEKLKTAVVQGALNGVFSVSPTKKVHFSQGNLQYRASTNTWRFAEHQYDIIGEANKNISSTYSGWIDLFGWGTSGYNDKYPYMTSQNDKDYEYGHTIISGTNYDWGVYNRISNGGNAKGLWRTLSYSEWDYLLNKRVNASNKWSMACIEGVNGLLLLPDNWILPTGLIFKSSKYDYTQNVYSENEWTKMDANGAIFLPAAGYRYSISSIYEIGKRGNYWSTSIGSDYWGYLTADTFSFYKNQSYEYVQMFSSHRSDGCSVRLVRNLK